MSNANIAIFVPHEGCPNQCSFCNQHSISGKQKAPTPEEVLKICYEGKNQLKSELRTGQIAFFGGSFTAIDREYMESLLEVAVAFVGDGEDEFTGIRISTRPDAIDEEILDLLRTYHVTAIELGAQSMDDKVLKANNRGHTAEDVRNASRLIKEGDMELGLQMMTGLYKSTPESDKFTAQELAKLNPDTVRIYPTIIIRDTQLEELYKQGLYQSRKLEETVELCGELLEFFKEKDIRVIRMGLHDSPSLEKDIIAGPYHPAFGELCEGSILLRTAIKQIEQLAKAEQFILQVSPKSVSKMVGQNKRNLKYLEQLGYSVRIQQVAGMEPDKVCVCPSNHIKSKPLE